MEKELIHEKIIAIMEDLDPIPKNKKAEAKGSFRGYRYRGIDDAVCATNPLFIKHKVYPRLEIIEVAGRLVNRFHFIASEDGSSQSTDILITGSIDKPQDGGVSSSYGYKTAVWTIFDIPTEETQKNDPDNKTQSESKTMQQKLAPKSKPAKKITDQDWMKAKMIEKGYDTNLYLNPALIKMKSIADNLGFDTVVGFAKEFGKAEFFSQLEKIMWELQSESNK